MPGRGGQATRDESRAQRREALLDTALRAIARHGPDASMREIAAEAGVTKPILYRHFGDQAGLAAALAERFAQMLRDEIPRRPAADPRVQTRRLLDAAARTAETHPHFYEYLTRQFGFGRSEADSNRNVAPLVGALRPLLAARGRDAALAEPWAHAAVGMVDRSLRWWVRSRKMSRKRFVDALDTLLWEGLGGSAEMPERRGR